MTPKTVEQGAALLDAKVPGWEEAIDLDSLDLSDTCNCIVGQLNGARKLGPRARADVDRYERGMAALGLDEDDGRKFGFNIWNNQAHFYILTLVWRRLILRRKDEAAREA